MSSLTSHLKGGCSTTAKLPPGPSPSFGEQGTVLIPNGGVPDSHSRNYGPAQRFAGQEQPL